MDKVSLNGKMGMSMKGSFPITNLMAKEPSLMQMEENILASGKITSNMDRGNSNLKTEKNILVLMLMMKKRELEKFFLRIAFLNVTSLKGKPMAKLRGLINQIKSF